jgi:hypothetical protein
MFEPLQIAYALSESGLIMVNSAANLDPTMKKGRFTEEQIISILKQDEAAFRGPVVCSPTRSVTSACCNAHATLVTLSREDLPSACTH